MAQRMQRSVAMAGGRLRRDRALDPDGRLRTLPVVIYTGPRRWTAPGAAARVDVSADGEVLSLNSEPYAALDARKRRGQHSRKGTSSRRCSS